MSDSVPEYYRALASDTPAPDAASSVTGPAPSDDDLRASDSLRYQADPFILSLPGTDWEDQTLYVLAGPTVDGLEHRITIASTSIPQTPEDAFVEASVNALQTHLEEGRVLLRDEVNLACGRPARRVIWVWFPDERRRYMEQLHVCRQDRGYTLSAVFTRNSRRRVGGAVEQVMLSFEPTSESSAPPPPNR
jgi:hypothetical protein